MKENRLIKLLSKVILILIILLILPVTSTVASNKTIEKKWTDEEIIQLGYIPDEVIVKFKKNKLDLKKASEKSKINSFTDKYNNDLKAEKRQLKFANIIVYLV
ncbi:hypothetical protein JW758_06315 [Candidatus Peregrinibacteria bacterium]|nr:hypothetical protein [Candidatus Peregrinibacteria bacterium]